MEHAALVRSNAVSSRRSNAAVEPEIMNVQRMPGRWFGRQRIEPQPDVIRQFRNINVRAPLVQVDRHQKVSIEFIQAIQQGKEGLARAFRFDAAVQLCHFAKE